LPKVGKKFHFQENASKTHKNGRIHANFRLLHLSRYGETQGVKFFSKKPPSKILLNRTIMLHLAQCACRVQRCIK
jgi:hypothetical protein